MRKLYFGVVVAIVALPLFAVAIVPEILTMLTAQEAAETQQTFAEMQRCEGSNADLNVFGGSAVIENTGDSALRGAELSWSNTSGEYVESLDQIQIGSTAQVSTPGVSEATVSLPECETNLSTYP